jgi:hypothetical protein
VYSLAFTVTSQDSIVGDAEIWVACDIFCALSILLSSEREAGHELQHVDGDLHGAFVVVPHPRPQDAVEGLAPLDRAQDLVELRLVDDAALDISLSVLTSVSTTSFRHRLVKERFISQKLVTCKSAISSFVCLSSNKAKLVHLSEDGYCSMRSVKLGETIF